MTVFYLSLIYLDCEVDIRDLLYYIVTTYSVNCKNVTKFDKPKDKIIIIIIKTTYTKPKHLLKLVVKYYNNEYNHCRFKMKAL